MKKLLFIAAMTVMSLTASAENVLHMVFKTADGVAHSIEASGLDIKFTEGKMKAANATETLTIPLSDLVSMEFDDGSASIYDTVATEDGEVTVSNINGIEIGRFPSLTTATDNLPDGIYVITQSSGKSLKLIINK